MVRFFCLNKEEFMMEFNIKEFNPNIHFNKEDLASFYKNAFNNIKDIFNVFSMLGKFIFKTIPELKIQVRDNKTFNDELNERLYELGKNEYIKSIFFAFPKVNTKKMITFMINYGMLVNHLDYLCRYYDGIKDKRVLNQLFLALLEAVEPSRKTSNYFKYFPADHYNLKNTDKDLVKLLVDSCRKQLKKIPSYAMVKEYIKKYVYMKKDYLIHSYLINDEYNQPSNWADNYNYTKYYPELLPWEFQAAAFSDLGLYALLSAAFDPFLELETVINIDKAYFPWINGLQVLLTNYVDLYQNIYAEDKKIQANEHNFLKHYDNLKQCEERLIFFYKKSLKICSELNLNNVFMHKTIIKLILAIYLSDSGAHIGLKKVASRNILESAGTFYLRFWKAIMPLITF